MIKTPREIQKQTDGHPTNKRINKPRITFEENIVDLNNKKKKAAFIIIVINRTMTLYVSRYLPSYPIIVVKNIRVYNAHIICYVV